jgi:hypothetical protein
MAEVSYQEILDATELWFDGRGFGFTFPPDIADVGYWVSRFYEMLLARNYSIDIEVRNVSVKNNDGVVKLNNPTIRNIQTLDINSVQTFEYDDFI